MNFDIITNFDPSNFDLLLRELRPFDAPPYVPNYPARTPGYEKLYYILDIIDQLIVIPHYTYILYVYTFEYVLRLIYAQVDWMFNTIDGNVTPMMLEFNRIINCNVLNDPAPTWLLKSNLGIRDYHNWYTTYTYRTYPTYELGRTVIYDLNLKWHLAFDPSHLGGLGHNMLEPKQVRPPIICLGADFVYGPIKGSFHIGWKLPPADVTIESISYNSVKFGGSASATPKLGIWLTLDLYEYNSAPAPRGPINIEELLKGR